VFGFRLQTNICELYIQNICSVVFQKTIGWLSDVGQKLAMSVKGLHLDFVATSAILLVNCTVWIWMTDNHLRNLHRKHLQCGFENHTIG